MKKSKIPAIGVPVRLGEKAMKRVPAPRPSKAQILEALVTLKIEQVQADRAVFDKETERLKGVALSALNHELERMPFNRFNAVSLPSSYDGKTFNSTSLYLDTDKHLSKTAKDALKAHYAHDNSPDKPQIASCGRFSSEDETRRIVRNQIREQLAVKEGTNKDRLTTMLNDKTFRTTLENTLAQIEGKTVTETESQVVEA